MQDKYGEFDAGRRRRGDLRRILIALMIIVGLFLYVGMRVKAVHKITDEEARTKITELENISRNLSNLQLYINNQKDKIVQQEIVIQQLTDEKMKLEPIIKMQRDNIEALFQLQEDRSRKQKWRDLFAAFCFGIASSLIADWAFDYLRRLR